MTAQTPPADGQARGRQRLAERRRRVLRIRKTVAAAAAAVFTALFAGLYAQMASGDDPVLGKRATTPAATAEPSPSVSSSSDGVAQSDEPAPVTTTQS